MVPDTVQAPKVTVDAVPAAVREVLFILNTFKADAFRPFDEAKVLGLSMALVAIAAVVAIFTRHCPWEMLSISLRAEAVHPPRLLRMGRATNVVLAVRAKT